MTQMPPPRTGCSSISPGDPIHINLLRKGFRECMDLMYSGHTFHVALICCLVLFTSNSTAEKALVILAALAEGVCIIGSRIHYTSDVLVSLLLSVMLFYSWPGVDNVFKHVYRGGLYGEMLGAQGAQRRTLAYRRPR